jgi:hypothetical protein
MVYGKLIFVITYTILGLFEEYTLFWMHKVFLKVILFSTFYKFLEAVSDILHLSYEQLDANNL